jgi:hypothetical protein
VEIDPLDVEGWTGLGRACVALDYPAGVAEVVEKLRALSPEAADRLAHGYAAAPGPGGEAAPAAEAAGGSGGEPAGAVLPATGGGLAGFDAWLATLRRRPGADVREADSGRLPLAAAGPSPDRSRGRTGFRANDPRRP